MKFYLSSIYARSPRIRRASWISFGMIVTLLAWMAHKFVSSNKPTKYASLASWRARTAVDWKRRSVLKSCAISRTRRWNGAFLINRSVLFWYFRISRRATVPGRYLWGFFTPPAVGADFLAALVASCVHWFRCIVVMHEERVRELTGDDNVQMKSIIC